MKSTSETRKPLRGAFMAKITHTENHIRWLKLELEAEIDDLRWLASKIQLIIFKQSDRAKELYLAYRITKRTIKKIKGELDV